MGLDMFLYKVKREEVAYWRKANAIHAWFEEHLAEGEIENCRDYYVSKEDLILLRDTCQRILNSCTLVNGKVQNGSRLVKGELVPIYEEGLVLKDTSLAEELLPTQSGFFFGSTAYDQYYIEDLKDTVEQINKILEEVDFDKSEIVYHAWW